MKNEEAKIKEQIELAIMEAMLNVDSSSSIDLPTLEKVLKTNLGQDIIIEKSDNNSLPWIVTKNGYQFQIQTTGKVASLGKSNEENETFEETNEDYFIWETSETSASIVGLKDEARSLDVISIPNTYQGLPVKKLSVYFAEYDKANNINETNEVLTKFIIPANLEEIQADALSNCFKLETIEVSKGNSKFKDIDGVLFSKDGTHLIQFPCNKIQDEYILPNTVEILGENAFAYTKVPNIILNDNLQGIRTGKDSEGNSIGAFDNSEFANKSKLLIQSNIINSGVYRAILLDYENAGLLNEIEVEEGSAIFSSNNGILFNKEGTILYKYPKYKSGTLYTTPNKVKILYDRAFDGNENLTTINCGENLKAIKLACFYNCKNITTVNFNEGLTYLGRVAFNIDSQQKVDLNIPTMPKTLTTIEDQCFENRNIKPDESIYSIEAINSKAIENVTSGTVTVSSPRAIYNYRLLENVMAGYVESDINNYDTPSKSEIPIAKIILDKTEVQINEGGEIVEITATINSNATEKIKWTISSGDGTIVSTSEDGKTVSVTGDYSGTIVVTASNGDGTVTAECRIYIQYTNPALCGYSY